MRSFTGPACRICGRHRGSGNHSACSRQLQKMADKQPKRAKRHSVRKLDEFALVMLRHTQ